MNKRLHSSGKSVLHFILLPLSESLQSAHFRLLKLHRSSKSPLRVLLHFVLFRRHMLFISVSHFLAFERWKKKHLLKSSSQKMKMRMWVRGRELLSSPLATLSLADQNVFVFLMESQTFPITLFPLVTPRFLLSSLWAAWEDLFIWWQCVAKKPTSPQPTTILWLMTINYQFHKLVLNEVHF